MSEQQSSLLVADSFRVRMNQITGQAEVRGWHKHLNRFRKGVHDACPELDQSVVEAFLAEAARAIQDYGEGFPRLELWQETNQTPWLSFSLRPLPVLTTELELRTAAGVVLENPTRKGPNIACLTALNHRLGAEALLADPSGCVIEGATTSLIWWDTVSQRGHVVQSTNNRVASVTEQLLANEVALTPSRIPPGSLTGHEVWALNALHGIRVVTAIDSIPTQKPNTRRLEIYTDALNRYWQPVLAA
ncbi:aminotransferase class IV [Leucobacter coleopterorum]|uniref:Aminotransferase class IV n=1 Tax=Leucobacter coleopterorum TaxID=2714933 RepID=A0ABX6JW87_9MICO|nr:aminotransferase class IV [Leucobacter coleopterorum]QIM18561.1 aminotransferase class IV [Leucobacter coleopterorum]